jgi:surface carbohydrate biosynthesis protein (TIGR04326 family)
MVHDETDRWKRAYLEWLACIGQAPVGNKTLEQQMLIRPGLSYWWMTLPTEFSFTEDALVYKAVRLWAFVELAERMGLDDVELVGADPEIISVLQAWGRETGRRITIVGLEIKRLHEIPRMRSLAKSSNVVIQFAVAMRRIALEFARYGLNSRTDTQDAGRGSSDLIIIDYFVNFQINQARLSPYESNYWGPLPENLALMGVPVHWIHIDYRSPAAPSVSMAREAIEDLNHNKAGQRHSLLQDQMSPRVLVRVLRQYFAIGALGMGVKRTKLSWVHAQSGLDMWPLIRRSWRRSFYGAEAAQNASWLSLFESVLLSQRTPGPCLYLMENQPWELTLISHWQAKENGRIAGVPHSTVRIWDLRYAVGLTNGQGSPPSELPRPDAVLVNGPAASGVFIGNGYRPDQLQPVEALRYMVSVETPDCRKTTDGSEVVGILALGEYDPRLATTQIELLNRLMEARAPSVGITYRPHPSSPAPLATLDGRIRLSASSGIAFDLVGSDLAFCSNVSSAAVDALLAGVPVIVFRDGSVLDGQIAVAPGNMSVTNAEDLIKAVDRFIAHGPNGQNRVEEVFYLDTELPRWTRVLSSL